MNIGILLAETIDHLGRKEFAQALVDISIAIDATAQREFRAKGRKSYKKFLDQNMNMITKTVTGTLSFGDIRFAIKHPDLECGPDGNVGLKDILYHLVRCGLLHEWSLPICIRFISENKISNDGHVVTLPTTLIDALVLAVVASPANKGQTIPRTYFCSASGLGLNFRLILDDWWGRREELHKILGLP